MLMDLNMKILVVDDLAPMRHVIKGILKQLGFKNIIEVEDGTEALRALKKEKFGLTLADWNMPNMNGLDLLKAVRSDETLKDIPFLMVTAGWPEKLRARVYLLKPKIMRL